mmetsp:Transcript_13844/g.19677  ORF Transcript_13844/g.19677 Transcript_13844/m.19677 type:complete len:108 (-) Transcript_13844:158-481(-)
MLELLACRELLMLLALEDFLFCFFAATLFLRLENTPFFRRGGASSAMQTLVGEGVRDAVAMVFTSKDGLIGSDGRGSMGREQDASFRGDMLFEVTKNVKRYVQKIIR